MHIVKSLGENRGKFPPKHYFSTVQTFTMASFQYLTKGKGKTSTIYLRLKNRPHYDITKSTGYTVDLSKWANGGLKRNATDATDKKLKIDLRDLETKILRLTDATPANLIDADWLKNTIAICKGEQSSNLELSDYVTDYVQHIIDTAHTRENDKGGLGLSESRIKSYGNLKGMIDRYQGNKTYRIKDVDKAFATKFLNWMLKKEYSKSYALKIISDLKTVCRDAIGNDIEVSKQLLSIKAPTVKNEKPIYLSPQELETIQQKELTREAHLNARKWLILGCHIGQRGSDLLNLTADNHGIRNGVEVIELTQQKTGKAVIIPLPKVARETLADGFPYGIALSKFNSYLKEICQLAGIDTPTTGRKSIGKRGQRRLGTYPKHELISSHVCRRTYASNYYGTMPTPLLLQITGHSTEKMLLKYIGKPSIDYVQQIADHYRLMERKAEKTAKMDIIKKAVNE